MKDFEDCTKEERKVIRNQIDTYVAKKLGITKTQLHNNLKRKNSDYEEQIEIYNYYVSEFIDLQEILEKIPKKFR